MSARDERFRRAKAILVGSAAMSRKNRANLAERVVRTAETTLAIEDSVCARDVLQRIGWLNGSVVERWRRGQIDCIEEAIQTNPLRRAEALEIFQRWATEKALIAVEADHVARTPQRQALHFTRSGDPQPNGSSGRIGRRLRSPTRGANV